MKVMLKSYSIHIIILLLIPLSIFGVGNEGEVEGNKITKKSYLFYLLKGDSLFNAKEYKKSYEQFILAKKISPEKEGALTGLYNTSIYLTNYHIANKWTKKLYKVNSSETNLERLVYSSALIGDFDIIYKIINEKDSKKYKHSNKVILSRLAGWGMYNNNFFIESGKWFRKELKKYPKDNELKKGKKLTYKLLNKSKSTSDLFFIPFNYENSDTMKDGFYLLFNTKYGNVIDNINFSIGYQSVTPILDPEIITKYDIKSLINTDVSYNFDNRYYLVINDSLLFDTTGVENYSFIDSTFDTILDTVNVGNSNSNGNNNNVQNINIIQTELALSYQYKFSSLFSSEIMSKYAFIKNSSISSVFLIGNRNSFDIGDLKIDLGFSGAYYSSLYSSDINNIEYETNSDTLFYSNTDTSYYSNPLGNDEMKIAYLDTSTVTTTLTETRYTTSEVNKDNFYSVQFNPSISYTYKNFFLQGKGYLYSILDSFVYDNKLRYFIELKTAMSFKYVTTFSGYDFGEINILNTENNRYFSMGSDEDIDEFKYNYYIGIALHNKEKSLSFTYKYKQRIYDSYKINSHLIGLGYTF